MPVSRTGTLSRSISKPRPPLDDISTEDEVRPAAPMSWIATIASVAISSRQASSSSFSVKGSPTCTVGRFSSEILVELRAGHGGAVDAVAPSLGADIDHRIAEAGRRRIKDLVGIGETHGHRIDQDVAVVARVEIDLAADRRHPHAIAVAADAGDHTGGRDAWSSDRRARRNGARSGWRSAARPW